MLVAESLKNLLFPFEWDHVYVPIVPTSHLHLIEAPVTYIMGLPANLALEEQADICVLDVDSNVLKLPEDIPNIPSRDELIQAINAILVKPSANQPNDPFSRLKLTTLAAPEPPLQNSSLAQRRLNRPPKLKIIRQCNVESLRETLTPEEKAHQILTLNISIRNCFLDHMCKMMQNYDKFVIYPPNREAWEANRDNMDNFERDVFLCDQAEQNLTFLSRFLETHMFSTFIDAKIVRRFNNPSESASHFDIRIDEIKRNVDEIQSPLSSDSKKSLPIYFTVAMQKLLAVVPYFKTHVYMHCFGMLHTLYRKH